MSINKKSIFIFIGLIFMAGMIICGSAEIYHKGRSLVMGQSIFAKSPYSMGIVFDGDHYKLKHPIMNEQNHLYLSLPDLEHIVSVKVQQNADTLTLTYEDRSITYKNGKIEKNLIGDEEIRSYTIQDNVIYIPDRHIEKFLSIQVDFFMDEKTNTVALSSPNEQKLANYDQQIGTTVFVHKKDVPHAKYEPRNGIYLGGYVLQDKWINMSMKRFNELTNKKHVTYFKYVGYGQPFPKQWVEHVISLGGFPHIAFEPNDGLNEVKDDYYLRQFAKEAGRYNVPILIRYASEMNGTWTQYSGQADLYIEKWKLVHQVMKEEAPNVMMLWNVFTMPEDTIEAFYPGDAYVDYVGVNIYNVVYHNDKLEVNSEFEDPLRLLDYVYNAYSARKPIVIGEFGATNYNVTDGLHHVDFAIEKISRMYKYLPSLYPRVKMIYYFDVNNLVNAPEGRKINNYAITENKRITQAYATYIGQKSYLTDIESNSAADEVFSYRDFLFYFNNKLYIDRRFLEDFLDMRAENTNDHQITVYHKEEAYTVNVEKLTIDKAAFFEKRELTGVPLIQILDYFKLKYEWVDGNLHIQM